MTAMIASTTSVSITEYQNMIADEDEQERQVEHQRHCGGGEELADRLDAVQARRDHAGRPVLEVRQRQPQQVVEHRAAEHRVDAVARDAAPGTGAPR